MLGWHEEVVDELGFTRTGGGFGELLAGGEHVEQGGLADIGTPDESHFVDVALGTSGQLGGGGEEGGLSEIHGRVLIID